MLEIIKFLRVYRVGEINVLNLEYRVNKFFV